MTISTPSTAATRGSSAAMYRSASAIVLCSFQLPAMNGVRLMAERLHARESLALDQLQRRAAAGGHVRDAVGEPELGHRGRGVAAADDGHGIRIGDRLGDGARARGERLELEGAHRAVPEHRAGRAITSRVAARAALPDVEAHPAVGNVDAVDRRTSVAAENSRPATRSTGSRSFSPPVARTRRAGSRPSSSQSESPTPWPCAAKNGKHIAPPIRTGRRAPGRPRGRRSCPSPWPRRRPRRAAAAGRAGCPTAS